MLKPKNRLDCIVKLDSSLSFDKIKAEFLKLESIVKFDSSLSICSFKELIGELECIVKFDFSLSGEDFKMNDAVCYAVFRAPTAKIMIIIKMNLKRTRDNQYGKARNDCKH